MIASAANTPLYTPPSGPPLDHSSTTRHCPSNSFTLSFPPTPFPDPSLSLSNHSRMDFAGRLATSCFRTRKGLKVEADFAAEEFFYPDAKAPPEHLVIMVNGLIGSAADWRYAAAQFVKKLPDKVIVHRSECNTSRSTFDGVDTMGERLAEEVLGVIRRRPELQKISFVAHSLGGLVSRYAIGRLFDHIPQLESSGAPQSFSAEEKKQHIEQFHRARIAGLEPVNFITVATPHLGSRGNKQFPVLCGLPFLERRASQTAHLVAGRSGKHLFLTDDENDGKPPLLLRMVTDSEDLKFISALRAFKRRVAYANVNYDHMVGWRTSSIRRQHELPKSSELMKNDKYPHIVYEEQSTHDDVCNKALLVIDQKFDLEEEMIRGLNQVPWTRVDVSFQKSRQRYIAHSTIQTYGMI
ncbi:putative lipase ROG1 isoform X2 [Benincasa hispida]|uniref:putative lipase ROG1 isoform X2 n=1 Tax=Benincasa hispida TaxID=102211 RepID=UPI001901F51C|nr:putative lipase ROG1 isoform X2 [Benincasa hispida]